MTEQVSGIVPERIPVDATERSHLRRRVILTVQKVRIHTEGSSCVAFDLFCVVA